MRVKACFREPLFKEAKNLAKEILDGIGLSKTIDLDNPDLTIIEVIVEEFYPVDYPYTQKYTRKDAEKFFKRYINRKFKEYKEEIQYQNDNTIYGTDCDGYEYEELEKVKENEHEIVYLETSETEVDCLNGWYGNHTETLYIMKTLEDKIVFIESYGNGYEIPYSLKIVVVDVKESYKLFKEIKKIIS